MQPWQVTAVTGVRCSQTLGQTAQSPIRARLGVYGRSDPFSDAQGTSGLRIRPKIEPSSRGAQAQECRSQRSTACLSRCMPYAPYPCRLSILLPPKMRRALQATGSETGRANKCGASRIRRRSRTHLAESDALGGPMKDRLWRWPIPVVIDRTRGSSRCSRTLRRPCDQLAAEQLAALVTGHAPCPVCGALAHCTSGAQLPVTV